MKISALAALLTATLALAAPHQPRAYSCDSVELDGNKYDLSSIKGTQTASKETDTPPTISEARVHFDVCGALKPDGEKEDQCPEGTQACLTLINRKKSSSPPERVTSVIPMWKGEDPTLSKVDGGIAFNVKGGDYSGTEQSLELTLKCASSAADPVLTSYTSGVLKVEWSTPAACAKGEDKPDPPPPSDDKDKDGDKEPETSSGWGFFSALSFLFWTGFFVLLAYFVIGIAYNHQQYSARGWDLVPHRDFWRELPSLAHDLGQHLAANVRQSTGGRGGYSSLG